MFSLKKMWASTYSVVLFDPEFEEGCRNVLRLVYHLFIGENDVLVVRNKGDMRGLKFNRKFEKIRVKDFSVIWFENRSRWSQHS